MKSLRRDGRGHWPAGKQRTEPLTAPQRAAVIRRLRKAQETESLRGIARTLRVSDRSIRRLLTGEDQPTVRMYALVRSRLPGR